MFGKAAKCSSGNAELLSDEKLMFRYLGIYPKQQIGSNPLPVCISISLSDFSGVKTIYQLCTSKDYLFPGALATRLESYLAVNRRCVRGPFPAGSLMRADRAHCSLPRSWSVLALLDPACISAVVVCSVLFSFKPLMILCATSFPIPSEETRSFLINSVSLS